MFGNGVTVGKFDRLARDGGLGFSASRGLGFSREWSHDGIALNEGERIVLLGETTGRI